MSSPAWCLSSCTILMATGRWAPPPARCRGWPPGWLPLQPMLQTGRSRSSQRWEFCIFSMVLGSLAQPQAVAPHMLKGVLAGVVAALIYRFGVQPHVQTVPELLVSVAPFLLLGGLARASRRTAIAAIDANMCFLLASQAVLPAVTRPAAILSEAGALVAAAALVTSSFILLPRRHDRHAARTREDIRRDLERLLANPQARRGASWDQGMTRQIMRLDSAPRPSRRGRWRRCAWPAWRAQSRHRGDGAAAVDV